MKNKEYQKMLVMALTGFIDYWQDDGSFIHPGLGCRKSISDLEHKGLFRWLRKHLKRRMTRKQRL